MPQKVTLTTWFIAEREGDDMQAEEYVIENDSWVDQLIFTATYEHDPGVHTFRNGDPGYPPTTEVNIESLEIFGLRPGELKLKEGAQVTMKEGQTLGEFIFKNSDRLTIRSEGTTIHEIMEDHIIEQNG